MGQIRPEQLELFPFYRQKWETLALSPHPLDLQKASFSVETAYTICGFPRVPILFFESPYEAFSTLSTFNPKSLGRSIAQDLSSQLNNALNPIESQGKDGLEFDLQLDFRQSRRLTQEIFQQLKRQLNLTMLPVDFTSLFYEFSPHHLAFRASWTDFCISVLGDSYPLQNWEVLQQLLQNCGWIFPLEKLCFVSQVPVSSVE